MSFHISYNKAIETIVWLAEKKPGIDIYHVAKILFYADKLHLNKYGRPIIGDTYIKMPYGPAPSAVLDLIKKNAYTLTPRQIDKISQAITVKIIKSFPSIKSNREPDLSYFSKTDLACLQKSFDENAELPFDDLVKSTHEEKSYIEASNGQPIDEKLMVDNDNDNCEDIRFHIEELSSYVRV